ncbi:MAG: SGNH/GDSL hydrolase family protein [Candidatus Saccharimonadales bacterium]
MLGAQNGQLASWGDRRVWAIVQTDCGQAVVDYWFEFEPDYSGIDTDSTEVVMPIGDSYSTAAANPPYYDELRGGLCRRSPAAWPHFLFQGSQEQPLIESSAACAGAKIQALYGSFQGEPPQLESVRAANPTIVTVTIGGNDAGFSAVLRTCLLRSCAAAPAGKRFSRLEEAETTIRKLQPRLKRAFLDLKKAAPRAQVYVVGYPRIFPSSRELAVNCSWLDNNERIGLNGLAAWLDAVERRAAKAAGVNYVSVLDDLDGHELCSADSWMFQVNPFCIRDVRCGHPLVKGEVAIAKAVTKAIIG